MFSLCQDEDTFKFGVVLSKGLTGYLNDCNRSYLYLSVYYRCKWNLPVELVNI